MMKKYTAEKVPFLHEEKYHEYLLLNGRTKATAKGEMKGVRYFAAWAQKENVPLTEANYNDVMAYMNEAKARGCTQRTLQIFIGKVKNYYDFLLHEKEVADNPCSNITVKGVRRSTLHETLTPQELETIYQRFLNPPQSITDKRNKVILGLVTHQALRSDELKKLLVDDVKLREGKISVPRASQHNERVLALEAHQVIELMDYINETRKELLHRAKIQSNLLFAGHGKLFLSNVLTRITNELKKQDKRVTELQQIRASVISNWLQVYAIRKVQYMAGHRYISATERYKRNNIDMLKEDINMYHPDL